MSIIEVENGYGYFIQSTFLERGGLPRVMIVQVQNPVTQIIATTKRGERGTKGEPGNILPAIYFDYGDATPAILYTPDEDQIIKSVELFVKTTFNGDGAKVSIGTAEDPELLMAEDESDLTILSSYETAPGALLEEGTQILAFITPGEGASTGRCMLLLELAGA